MKKANKNSFYFLQYEKEVTSAKEEKINYEHLFFPGLFLLAVFGASMAVFGAELLVGRSRGPKVQNMEENPNGIEDDNRRGDEQGDAKEDVDIHGTVEELEEEEEELGEAEAEDEKVDQNEIIEEIKETEYCIVETRFVHQ